MPTLALEATPATAHPELHSRCTPDPRRRLQPDRQRRVSAVRSAGHGVHDSDPRRDRRAELRRRAHHDRLPALERKRRNLELDGLVLGRPQQCSELDGLRIRARRRDRPGTDPARATYRFASGTTWTVYSDYPGEGQASTELGTAQLVCLSAAGCPAGATDYGSPFGGAWTSNLSSIPGAGWIWRPGVTGATPNADFPTRPCSRRRSCSPAGRRAVYDIAVDDSAEMHASTAEVVGSIRRGGAVREPDEVRPLRRSSGRATTRSRSRRRTAPGAVRVPSRRTRPGSFSGARSAVAG